MLNYYINISVDDDFGVETNHWIGGNTMRKVEGMLGYSGNTAEIDPVIISSKNFWKPVERFLKYGKEISKISNNEFMSLFADLGEIVECSEGDIRFDTDNDYDLVHIRHDIDRISFNYKNCPVYSFYLIQVEEADAVKIILGPYTKDYFVISEWQWMQFINHLKKDVRENREIKLNEILGEEKEYKAYTNIIRQLKFLDKTGKTDSFQSSVLDFYDKRGYITEKQAKIIKSKL